MSNVMLYPSGFVVVHLGINTAPQSGSGSGCIDHLCCAYCYLQDSIVRLILTLAYYIPHWSYTVCILRSARLDKLLYTNIIYMYIKFVFLFFRPTYSVLGNIPGTELYVDIETHNKVKQKHGKQ